MRREKWECGSGTKGEKSKMKKKLRETSPGPMRSMSLELRSMISFTLSTWNKRWINKPKKRRGATTENMLRMSDHSHRSTRGMDSVGGRGACIFKMRLQIGVPAVTHTQFNSFLAGRPLLSFITGSPAELLRLNDFTPLPISSTLKRFD